MPELPSVVIRADKSGCCPDAVACSWRDSYGMTSSRVDLKASPGDRLVIKGHRSGDPGRDAEILQVLGSDGAPPYVVRWEEDGHVSELYPGPDAYIQHFRHEMDSRRG
jgi:hypothetical protein